MVSAIVDAGASINLYMFHGDINFGFINGAMHFNEYKSDVTSYGKCSLTWPGPACALLELLMASPLGTASVSQLDLSVQYLGKVVLCLNRRHWGIAAG